MPEVPSAKEVEKEGMDAGALLITQMKKIEELTLYMIEMKKDISNLKKENSKLKEELNTNK